jgi:RNA polymerase sigma-70 factor (ECF subfamily)
MLAQLVKDLPQDATLSLASPFAAPVPAPVPVDVTLAASGDRVAFERVYRAHVDRVYSLCARMMGDRGLAEELTQDVFVRVWEKLPLFRGDSAFTTWLHRVTVNVVLTRRKMVGIHESRVSNDEHAESFVASRSVSVGDQMDLEAAIAGLPAGARRIFVLHDVEGFTHDEIGEQLGITAGGSKAQLHRARSLLRVALSR